MVVCMALHATRPIENYDDKEEFETLSQHRTSDEAQQQAMHLLEEKGKAAGLWKRPKGGKSKSAPVSMVVPKNTSNEFENKLGFGTLFK